MVRHLGWGLGLLALCVSCVTVPQRAALPAAELAQGEETADAGCAYFYFLWGKSAEAEHRFDEALEAYEKALVCDPTAEHVMRDLVVFYIKMNRSDDASRLVEQLLALHPGDMEIRTLKAGLLASLGQVDEAAVIYTAILVELPEDGDTMLRLGSLYAGSGRFDEARQVLEELVRIDKQSFVGHQYLAKLYRQQGAYDKAIASYDRALELHWLPSLALEAVDLLEFRKVYDQAVSYCRRVLDNEPDDEKARQRLVSLFLQMGEVDQALAELRELRQHAVNVFDVDVTIGRILIEQQQYEAAISHFSEMLAASPDSGNLHYLLALAHGAKGDDAEAIACLQRVAPADSVYEDAVLLLVELLVKNEQGDVAEQLLVKAIAGPESRRPRLYGTLASLYRKQGRNEAGRRVLEEALPLYPEDSRLHYEYAIYLDRIGSLAEALVAMQDVLGMDAHNPYALNYVGYTWADRGENLEEARRLIEQAVALRPEDGFIRDSLGWVYFKLGELDRAVAELNTALELAADPVIFEHLGDVHRHAGRIGEAVAAYEQAVPLFEEEADRQRMRDKIKALRPAAH